MIPFDLSFQLPGVPQGIWPLPVCLGACQMVFSPSADDAGLILTSLFYDVMWKS